MKRSEKEAEVRRLLETPGAVVQLPAGMSVQDAGDNYEELVQKLVAAGEPIGGWEIGPTPGRLRLVSGSRPGILPLDRGWASIEEREDSLRAAVNAYNAMKEAEEAESNPNDPLTVALERVAAEEVAKLIEDAVNVAREETLKECAAKCASKYTREEFVAAEIELSLKLRDEEPEDIDPFALSNIRQRAGWNAQAAERAGVVWRHQNAKVACRNCGGYEWPEKISDYGECRKCVTNRDEAWKTYASSWRYNKDIGKDDGFDAGFSYGYQAGWRARMDTLNPVCSPEAVDETLAADIGADIDNDDLECNLEGLLEAIGHTNSELHRQSSRISELIGRNAQEHVAMESRLDQHKASIATIAESQTRVESEWKIQGQKYTADLRRVSGKLELLEESIDGAHSRLQLHDGRITKTEEQIRTFIQPAKEQEKED